MSRRLLALLAIAVVSVLLLMGSAAFAQGEYPPTGVGATQATQTHATTAKTGTSSTIPLTTAGVGLVIVGATLVAIVRRRRAAPPLA